MRPVTRWILAPAALAVLSCSGGERWGRLTGEEYTLYAAVIGSELSNYVAAQAAYCAENGSYARSTRDLPRYGRRTKVVHLMSGSIAQDGFSAIAYHDSVPQMVCAVFVGSVSSPLGDRVVAGAPSCQRESSILSCPEGHAYPSRTEFNYCPIHGEELRERRVGW